MTVDSTTEERLREAETVASQEGNEDTEEIVLTDRELAIINGDDPDELGDDGSETSIVDGGGSAVTDDDEAGKDAQEPAEQSWMTDELKQLAATYELDEDDIKDFGNGDEFLRAASMLEKLSLKAAQRQWQAVQDSEKTRQNASPTGKVDPVVETAAERAEGAAEKLEDKIKKLREEGFDESLIGSMEALATEFRQLQGSLAQIKPVVETQQQRNIAEVQGQVMGSFHDTVDRMGGRYGGADTPVTPEQEANRERLFNAARLVERDILARGQQRPAMSVILKRAELLAFGDDIRKEKQAALAKQVREQSGKRRSAGRTVTPRGKQISDGEDPVAEIANSPEMVALFKSFEEK